MIQITAQMRALAAIEPVDGRKGIDSLARLCQDKLAEDPFSGCVFVFRSRRGTAIRLLSYDGQGYWLAQIVCQIIRKVEWERQFKCEGILSLADFSALVDQLGALDPVAIAMRPGKRRPGGSVPDQLQPSNVVRFAKKLDALLDLLAATADGLAAEWDLQQDGISTEADLDAGDDFKPTIQ